MNPSRYTGPVPIVTHVHGAHSGEESDGYPEAWYLPKAANIPAGYSKSGHFYATFKAKAEALYGQVWDEGKAVFQYPNDQRPTTLWYHDHTLGMTRANVYAGPAGFYLIRGGPDEFQGHAAGPGAEQCRRSRRPKPIWKSRSSSRTVRSMPTARCFYPDNRAFFEGRRIPQLQIPFHPTPARRAERCPVPLESGVLRNSMVGQWTRVALTWIWNAVSTGSGLEWVQQPVPDSGVRPAAAVHADRFRRGFSVANRAPGPPASQPGVAAMFWRLPAGASGHQDTASQRGSRRTVRRAGNPAKTSIIGPRDHGAGDGVPGGRQSSRVRFRSGRSSKGLPAFMGVPAATQHAAGIVDGNRFGVRPTGPGGQCGFGLAPTACRSGRPPDCWASWRKVRPTRRCGGRSRERVPNQTVEEWEILQFHRGCHPIHLHLVQFQVVNRHDW